MVLLVVMFIDVVAIFGDCKDKHQTKHHAKTTG
jgi:hypothetical protein